MRIVKRIVDSVASRRNLLRLRVKREVLAPCGNRCDLCPAFNENVSSLFMKARISQGWEKYFGLCVPPGEVECVGCSNKGKIVDRHCPVRSCVRKYNVRTCADCSHYPCGKVKPRLNLVEEVLREFPNISRRDRKLFIQPYDSKKRLTALREEKKEEERQAKENC
ncbi:MAG TPA: DUF3795 domain-containing protein [Bacillota bacterium]|nr:DUF3795 domain-containing protein [Bacillota bacterium]